MMAFRDYYIENAKQNIVQRQINIACTIAIDVHISPKNAWKTYGKSLNTSKNPTVYCSAVKAKESERERDRKIVLSHSY